VVAFFDNAVNTLVVPLIKLPETTKLTAVVVPFNAGLASGALAAKAFAIGVAKLASPFNADESCCNVFNNAGAAPIKSLILLSVWALV
jgi:hypothetical protein